ncbi:MAG: RNA polymerase sigma factor [Chloroflexota bacterium]|nr:RNA polymerase sigma factor [Chloroflexota bacterium]
MLPATQAVDALISQYGKLVFHTIYGLTGDWEESQDLTQDTFHQALKSIDDARAKSGADFREKAWLLSIAVNTVRMQRRRRNLFRFIPFSRMQKKFSSESTEEGEADTLNERPAPVQPAGYGAIESEDPAELIAEQDAVQRTMRKLSEPFRECLLLSIIGNFSTSEIANMLNLQEAAVRQRLARARKQFQQMYELESGEQMRSEEAKGTEALEKETYQKRTNKRQKREEHVESHLTNTASSSYLRSSNYAERFYREPAFSPLW